ncbi:MAG: hypothetical protein PWQ45_99 [Thermosipho sp. (in: thermotogales)]|jgi:hypothetical protein|nr:hypothetical protein [Thermosipho sp. (in: thermotogales)]
MGATINLRNDILEKVINGTDFTIQTVDAGQTLRLQSGNLTARVE